MLIEINTRLALFYNGCRTVDKERRNLKIPKINIYTQ